MKNKEKPQELFFNENTRKNSARAKLKLLVHGVRDNPGLLNNQSFKEEHYAYDNGNWGINKKRLVPTELILPGDIVSKVHFRPDSPITMRCENGKLIIEESGKFLSEFEFLPRPEFWNLHTSSGVSTKRLAQMYGKNCLNFNIYSGCQYHDVGYGCQFCSVTSTVGRKSDHGIVIRKSPQELAEVCNLASTHDVLDYIIITGGSFLDGDREFDSHMAVIRAIKNNLPWNGRIRGNVSLMPPKTESKLIELYDEGVDNPSFNLEVWPQVAFDKICPGKSKYVGFSKILRSFEILVNAYGEGKVWCNFVAGLVPADDLKKGFDAIAAMGVVPGANIFHPEVGSQLGQAISSPSESFIMEIYTHSANIYSRLGYKPFFNSSILRNSLANEIYEGLL